MRSRPFLLDAKSLSDGQAGNVWLEPFEPVGNQDEPLVLRPPFAAPQKAHTGCAAGIASQSETGRGGVSDDAAAKQVSAQASDRDRRPDSLPIHLRAVATARQPISLRICEPAKLIVSAT